MQDKNILKKSRKIKDFIVDISQTNFVNTFLLVAGKSIQILEINSIEIVIQKV